MLGVILESTSDQVGNVREEERSTIQGALIRMTALFATRAQGCGGPSEKQGDTTPQNHPTQDREQGHLPYGSHHCVVEDCVGIKNPWIVLLVEKASALGPEIGNVSLLRAACRAR